MIWPLRIMGLSAGRLRRALAVACAALVAGSVAAEPCRLGLALGLDVSGSVDEREYRAQREGLAWALRDAEVQDLLIAPPEAPVEIAVYEWSGPDHARPIVAWTPLTSVGVLNSVADDIVSAPGAQAPLSTAVGAALAHGAGLLATRDCQRRVLDLSADGMSNAGPRPNDLPLLPADVTVNALLIGDEPGLEPWFRARVIHGPAAFIERADSHADYGAAMKRKLLREAAPPRLSAR